MTMTEIADDAIGPAGSEDDATVRHGTSAVAHWGEQFALPVAWVLMVIVFTILRPDTFPTQENFSSILGSQAVLFMLALAALLPSMTGDIDLSLGSIGGLSAIIIGVLNVNHGLPIFLACAIGVAAATLAGAMNALVVVKFKTEPLIMTLGTGAFFAGLMAWIAGSTTIVGVATTLSEWTYLKRLVSVPVQFYYCAALMLIIWYVARYTPVGVRALFVGQSRDVASLSGINTARMRTGSFTLAGLVAGLAGVLYVGTTGSVGPTSMSSLLLPAYAAVFLGATTIQPGRFNPLGTGVALLFLATGTSGLQLLDAEDFAQQIFYGLALVLAVSISRYLRRS